MAGFTPAALEKKLSDLNSTQQSIQTLSFWLIHHRKNHKTIVQVWFRELKKAKPTRKLNFLYLANDVIQNSKKKGPEFSREFSTVLGKAFAHVCGIVTDDKTRNGLERIIKVWEERSVYDSTIIEELREAVAVKKSVPKKVELARESKFDKIKDDRRSVSEKRSKHIDNDFPVKKKKHVKEESEINMMSPPGKPPDTDALIKALQELENAPSSDAEVRQQIASLPQKVSDINYLDQVNSREDAEKLLNEIDEACQMLNSYNSRLAKELDLRKQVSKMLNEYLHFQREQNSAAEKIVEEYEEKLKTFSQVRTELKSHLQNLPDLTLLPSVTGGLAPLPSAGDLFNQP